MENIFEAIETSDTVIQPELRLWAAVLTQGIKDMHEGTDLQRIDAIEWAMSSLNEINSFIGICQLLDIDPAVVRELIFNREEVRPRVRVYGKKHFVTNL